MNRINIAQSHFDYPDSDPEGFKGGMVRPGPDFGATRTGVSAYELPPAQALCPYHYEWGEEEWLLVLEGKPTLRDPAGEHELGPMDLVFFERGPGGAHKVTNETDDTVRFLMFSDLVFPAATVYPDSDKIGIWTDRDRTDSVMVRRSSNFDYYEGEVDKEKRAL
jgi:uncharacterized cupin superfamily protein